MPNAHMALDGMYGIGTEAGNTVTVIIPGESLGFGSQPGLILSSRVAASSK